MTKSLPCGLRVIRTISVVLLVLFASEASSTTLEQETLAHLEQIKAIRAGGDTKTIESYNKHMDEAWKFFNANKTSVLPILRKELTRELQKDHPNDLLLLDIGYFIRLQPDTQDKELGKAALLRLDSASPIISLNQQQLFNFAHSVAADQDPKILSFLDKTFLKSKVTVFLPQHSLKLDETLVCVFLYGIHGQSSEPHLRSQLGNRDVAQKIIEILIWIGTPNSVQDVKAAMMSSRDFETFARGTAFMMSAGGPQGRSFLLEIDPKDFDVKSQEYYAKVRNDIEATSYPTLRKRFAGGSGSTVLSENELKQRLAAMYTDYGKDDDTDPSAILDSKLPQAFLCSELQRIRARIFNRLSDEALSDVETTNAILNTLYYKTK